MHNNILYADKMLDPKLYCIKKKHTKCKYTILIIVKYMYCNRLYSVKLCVNLS